MTTTNTACPEIYVLATGEKIRASTAVELIEFLRVGSFDRKEETLEQYMVRVSERILLSSHAIVRIDTPENFVKDLRKVGLITNVFMAN